MKFLRIVLLFCFTLIINSNNAISQEKEIDLFLNDLLKFANDSVRLSENIYDEVALSLIKDNRRIFFPSFNITYVDY